MNNTQAKRPKNTTDQQLRKCRLCNVHASQGDTIQVKQKRYVVLKMWYPEQIRKPADWVHKRCLAQLGLHPFPDNPNMIEKMMSNAVIERIKHIASGVSHIRGPRQLIDVVCEQINSEYHVPTQRGRRQLRYLVSN